VRVRHQALAGRAGRASPGAGEPGQPGRRAPITVDPAARPGRRDS